MKTTCFLVTLIVAAVLAVNGAPANKTTPAFIVSCPDAGNCNSTIQFDFTGLNPSTTYDFTGASATDSCCGGEITPNLDGTFSFQVAFLSSGDWVFTLTAEHKNDRLAHSSVVQPLTVP